MKIVSSFEPLYCEINDLSYKVIVDITATTTKDQLVESIRKWMPLSFESMVSWMFKKSDISSSSHLSFCFPLFRFTYRIGKRF